ncbi:MAG: hypothetical protein M1834_002503 [Cirrosporium novae-zelandiae]|nr:MAG: hypothetical protein M1834_002503 [Cirrosporium novae-zelandiae]
MISPNFSRSTVKDVTFTPVGWTSSPKIERSTLTSCTFHALDENTRVERSNLNNVVIETLMKTNFHSKLRVERSDIKNSLLSDGLPNTAEVADLDKSRSYYWNAYIERSDIKDSRMLGKFQLERNTIQTSSIADSNIQRSTLKESIVSGKTKIERSELNASTVITSPSPSSSSNTSSSNIQRSTLHSSRITNSGIDRCSLKHCKISNSYLSRCNLEGMVVENGRWENNELVKQLGDSDPVMRKIVDEPEEQPQAQYEKQSYQPSQQPSSPPKPDADITIPPNTPLHIHIAEMPSASSNPNPSTETRREKDEVEKHWSTLEDSDPDQEIRSNNGPGLRQPSDSPPPYRA